MDFTSMDVGAIATGVGSDGTRHLETFLKEYTSIFHETVNPGCNKCLTSYLNKYKNHFKAMANTSEYRLHAKYENIPLEFGSPILVNNGNITDEYAKKLLEHKNGERYFAQLPEAGSKPKKKAAAQKEEKPKDIVPKSETPKEDVPVKTLEQLQADLDAAELEFKELPEKAHHMKVKAAENKITSAKEAIAAFEPENKE